MNLQHERMLSLCETLTLPFVAQAYLIASQEAAQKETAYSDFLEGLIKAEGAGRNMRKQTMLTCLAGFPAIKTLDDFDYRLTWRTMAYRWASIASSGLGAKRNSQKPVSKAERKQIPGRRGGNLAHQPLIE